ncbi:MAG: hypothetical protein ACMG57_00340 [Candidatus Dojkabacteria bacterium]
MKVILIKLFISIIIVIFVPLPNPLYTPVCDTTLQEIQSLNGLHSAPIVCEAKIPFPQNGFLFITKFVSYFSTFGQAYTGPATPRDIGIGYGIISLLWVGIIYLVLTIGEFVASKLKQKSNSSPI